MSPRFCSLAATLETEVYDRVLERVCILMYDAGLPAEQAELRALREEAGIDLEAEDA